MTKKAVIIGAGYGGIALATLLANRGYDVHVFEKNDTPGGRISVLKKDGFTFDLGPSWYLMPEIFNDYYELFGKSATDRLQIKRLTPGYRVFFENTTPITVQGDTGKDAATFDALESGAGTQLQRYIKRSSEIYKVATGDFLYSNFERPLRLVMKHAWLLASTTTRSLDSLVSGYFKDDRIKKILEYQAVFLGNSPYELPAIYSLMSKLDFESGVFYPSRGMPSLIHDLIDLLPAGKIQYHYNTPVEQILVNEKGEAEGVTLSDGTVVDANIVISNADLHFTETRLLKPQHRSFPEKYWSKRQSSPGGLVISLGVKGELPELTHHSLLFVEKWKENFEAIYKTKTIPETASLYICNPSKSDPSLAPEGHENLFILAPIPSGVSLEDAELDTVVDRYIGQTAQMIGVPDLHERIVTKNIFTPSDFEKQYNAWDFNAFGGESHLLFQSAPLRTRNKSKKVKNLYYVGAGTYPGVGLPMCLISAQQTYKRIEGLAYDGPLLSSDIQPNLH